MEPKDTSQNRVRHTLRVLRPLLWWFMLVLVLYGIRTHQRLMEQTRLHFRITLKGQPLYSGATFDGYPAVDGAHISLGLHSFTVTHPKGESFFTNLFVWYGGWDVGNVDLKRTKGKLSIQSNPKPKLITIEGPEFSTVLMNTSGTNLVVPTDRYQVTARFAFSEERASADVYSNMPASVNIRPQLGAAHLASSHSKTTFELTSRNNGVRLSGELPVIIAELPIGEYELAAERLGERKTALVRITAGRTNDVLVEYTYGAVTIETEPSDATVFDINGRRQGTTPLTLSELRIGNYQFTVKHEGFESVTATIRVSPDTTNSFRTNLVNIAYASAMENARRFIDNGSYDRAAQSLADALRVQPDDASATSLLHQVRGLSAISRAERYGQDADYPAAEKELEKALVEIPDNPRARQLLAEFKQRQIEQQQRETEQQQRKAEELARQERERREAFTNEFDGFTGGIVGAGKVETHELETSKGAKEVQAAITEQLRSVAPIFRLSHVGWTNDMFYMNADQEVAGGGRLCMIVGAPIKDGETRIRFKVIEFKSEAVGLKILGTILADMTKTTYQPGFHPLNPSDAHLSDADKNRIADGVKLVTERIQGAIGP